MNARDSEWNSLGSSPDRRHYVAFLGKTLSECQEIIASEQAPGKDRKKIGEQSERTSAKLTNSESKAIGAGLARM